MSAASSAGSRSARRCGSTGNGDPRVGLSWASYGAGRRGRAGAGSGVTAGRVLDGTLAR